VSKGMGIKARKLVNPEEAESAVKELAESEESMLLHAVVTGEANVLPMVPAGKSLDNVIQNM